MSYGVYSDDDSKIVFSYGHIVTGSLDNTIPTMTETVYFISRQSWFHLKLINRYEKLALTEEGTGIEHNSTNIPNYLNGISYLIIA